MTRRRRKQPLTGLPRCVLDSGGLSALCGGSQTAKEWLRWISANHGSIVIPTAILVESTTGHGARDAEVNGILRVLLDQEGAFVGADETTARRAGSLRYRARSDDGIDALVAATAVGDGSPAVVLTSDPDDLARLLDGERHVSVEKV
jgi:predicted nucleic acid-binding protein